MVRAGQINDRLKENLKEALKESTTDTTLDTIQFEDSIDMESAADKALKIIDRIIYGEKVQCVTCSGIGNSHGGLKITSSTMGLDGSPSSDVISSLSFYKSMNGIQLAIVSTYVSLTYYV